MNGVGSMFLCYSCLCQDILIGTVVLSLGLCALGRAPGNRASLLLLDSEEQA